MDLSVIVPTYNSEKYLRQTISSILTLKEMVNCEVIVVDDGSTDGTKKILVQYSEDVNFKVFTIDHAGVSVARNFGLAQATGNYVTFVDSDDLIDSKVYQALMASAQHANEPDIVTCSGSVTAENDQRLICSEQDKNKLLLSNLYISSDEFTAEEYLSGPVSKLYKRSFLTCHQILFPVGVDNGEDLVFNCYAIIHSHQILVVHNSAYFYRHNMTSLMCQTDLEMRDKNEHLLVEIKQVLLQSTLLKKSDYLAYWSVRVALTNIVRLYWRNPKRYLADFQAAVLSLRVNLKHAAVGKLSRGNLSRRQLLMIAVLRRVPTSVSIKLVRIVCRLKHMQKIRKQLRPI